MECERFLGVAVDLLGFIHKINHTGLSLLFKRGDGVPHCMNEINLITLRMANKEQNIQCIESCDSKLIGLFHLDELHVAFRELKESGNVGLLAEWKRPR